MAATQSSEQSSNRTSKQTAKRLFFFALVFPPLAFGTVEPWSYAVMEIAVAGALLVCLVRGMADNRPVSEVPGLFFVVLMLGWVLFQLVPLPPDLVRILSPAAFNAHQNAVPGGESHLWMTLSVHPRATLAEFFRYATYAAIYILTVQLLANRDVLRQTVFAVTVFGALLAFSSILQLYLTMDMALWVRHVPVNSMIVGPYICHNHYAGLMAMIFPVVLALFLFLKPRIRNTSILKGIKEVVSQEKANIHILVGTAALLIVVSIVLSLSRGGMISTCLALLVFTALLLKKRISRTSRLLITLIVILACLCVSWFGWEPIIERFSELKNKTGAIENSRLDYWKDSVRIIRAYPFTGSGFGTFKDIYHSYQSIGENHYVDHAHNDYLELLAEGGAIGFLLFAAFLAAWLIKSYRTFKTRRDPYSIYIYIGSLAGVSAMICHSVSDFNMQIGANGLWFFFLLGLAVSAANTRMQLPEPATKLAAINDKRGRNLLLVFSGALFVAVLVFSGINLAGSFYYTHIADYQMDLDTPDADLKKIRSIASLAARFDPRNAAYVYAAADASWLLSDREAAEAGFLRAIRLNPVKALYYKRYGLFLTQAGETDRAERMLELSVRYDPVRSDNALEYGALLISQGKKEEGARQLRRAIELNKDTIRYALGTMAVAGFTIEEMRRAMPDLPAAAVAFGKFLDSAGEPEAAENSYRHALDLMAAGRGFRHSDIYRIYRFFKNQGRTQAAMEVMQRAEALLPRDAGIKIMLGDLYKAQGIFYKAKAKYEAALLIEPGNERAIKRIKELSN